jgi:hypothetical protein
MCGMKNLNNVKTNFKEVMVKEPLTVQEFLKAVDFSVAQAK